MDDTARGVQSSSMTASCITKVLRSWRLPVRSRCHCDLFIMATSSCSPEKAVARAAQCRLAQALNATGPRQEILYDLLRLAPMQELSPRELQI